ncbi:Bifunctional uridylyltransferase/uridylyl-removing enzyme [Corynebacterium atrinae]|uniref:[protein-PII] uridylyltransferase n=1 Tax=Corynebacterium atrinae TaxID=1336740 RepID=UPI0025B3BFBB|nr:[protein-PII] uridylyltransferase [Corynebacterium atrinae]WJY63737.1 Bifunctional uridylyltransferase/uridylyl-removing enzyme [Corynebacterium atrinae]
MPSDPHPDHRLSGPEPHPDPAAVREQVAARAFRLLQTLPLPDGCALVATGSLARREMTEHSDLDLIFLHPAEQPPTQEQVEQVWTPIWDAKFRLDYSVRTPEECAAMIAADSTAALALLEMRHLRGDAGLTERAHALVRSRWRTEISRNFDALVSTAAARWRRAGSVVAMTHPDLKHGRGGLRDIDLLNALATANLCDAAPLSRERTLLLDVRTLLHRATRRLRDVLDPEFAEDISAQLGMADRYELSTTLAEAARRVDDALNAGLATARGVLAGRSRAVSRRPLDLDVVDAGGQITLSRNPDYSDPALILRVAAAAARTGLPIAEHTWLQLDKVPALPPRWTAAAADDFFALLASPEHSARVIENLDRHGRWEPMVPEWSHVRGRMPRERTHIHTIDAHSLVTVALCAAVTVQVARPDLLLLAALFHDIGKGYGRPHAQVGAEFVARMAVRLGLNLPDRSRVQTLVAEHTTMARLVATTDPTSDASRDLLLDALHYDLISVNLLEVLTEADARATGPGVWNRRLESGVRVLARRARQALTELTPARPHLHAPTDLGLRVNDEAETLTVWWRGSEQRVFERVLAVAAAKAWTIIGARLATDSEGLVHVELDVRPAVATLAEAADADGLVQAYKSGVYSTLPQAEPGPTATYWNGAVLEVRTVFRPRVLGTLLSVLPELSWLEARTPGATFIVQAAFAAPPDRVQVDKDVTRALARG